MRTGASIPLRWTRSLRASVLFGALVLLLGLLGWSPVSAAAQARPSLSPSVSVGHAEHPHVYAGRGVIAFGNAQPLNASPTTLSSVMVAIVANPASTATSQGYWLASADGGVFAEGNAQFYGSLGNLTLTGPIVGMAATPDGKGYWLVAMDGGVFAFGDAAFYGSMGGTRLNQPVVGMASTPDGKGYWLVASDGGIFSFGDATFYGSMGGTPLNAPVVGMAATAGGGYWMVASDGGMFAFGDAPFYGSMGGSPLNDPITGMVAFPHSSGYMLVSTDGGIFGFGGINFFGSLGGGYGGNPADVPPVAGMALTPGGDGYWLLEPDGWSYSFSNPPSPAPSPTASAIVSIANSQVNTDPTRAISAIPTDRAKSGVRCSPPGCGNRRGCRSRPTRSPGTSTTGRQLTRECSRRLPHLFPETMSSTARDRLRRRPHSTSGWWCRSGRTVPSSPSKGTLVPRRSGHWRSW